MHHSHPIRIGIVGIQHRVAAECAAMLCREARYSVVSLVNDAHTEYKLGTLYPDLHDLEELAAESLNSHDLIKHCKTVILCSDKRAHPLAQRLRRAGVKVIEFMTFDSAWHKFAAKKNQLDATPIRGLPELFGKELKRSSHVILPHPVSSLITLALAPLLQLQMITHTHITAALITPNRDNITQPSLTFAPLAHWLTDEVNNLFTHFSGHPLIATLSALHTQAGQTLAVIIHCKPLKLAKMEHIMRAIRTFYKSQTHIRLINPNETVTSASVSGIGRIVFQIELNAATETFVIKAMADSRHIGGASHVLHILDLMHGFDAH